MTEELDILKMIVDNPKISQRKIAEQTGISLGQVNFLIKKCVKKGLIKIEGQTSKSIKYNLTPKGFSEKASRALHYIKLSYNAVFTLTENIKRVTDEYKSQGYEIYIYGSQDEMMEIVMLAVEGKAKFIIDNGDPAQLNDNIIPQNNTVVFYWETDKTLDLTGYEKINILD